jgi:RNA recognition motif-containing protein
MSKSLLKLNFLRQSKTVRLQHFINEDNRHRLAKIRGLAWGVTRLEVACLFQEFGITENDVVIETDDGKNTGYALVFMKDSQSVEMAKQTLNK